jgi:hypothetical protein
MHKKLSTVYANITREQIADFLDLCETCQLKMPAARKSIVVKPMVSKQMNYRCQVQLFAATVLTPCVEKFMAVENVPPIKSISVREAARLSSMGSGQGFSKCGCKGECDSARCKCFKRM